MALTPCREYSPPIRTEPAARPRHGQRGAPVIAACVAVLFGIASVGCAGEPDAQSDASTPSSSIAFADSLPPAAEPARLPAERTSYTRSGPVDDVSYADVKRVSLRITIPLGRSREEVEATLRRAVDDLVAEASPDALMVLGYRPGDSTDGVFSVGRAIYAPNGRWEDAETAAPKRVVVEIGSLYFEDPADESSPVGQVRRIQSRDGSPVILSDEYGSWGDDNILTRLPVGARVTVLEKKSEAFTADYEFVRYRVRAKVKGREVEGWVHDTDLSEN